MGLDSRKSQVWPQLSPGGLWGKLLPGLCPSRGGAGASQAALRQTVTRSAHCPSPEQIRKRCCLVTRRPRALGSVAGCVWLCVDSAPFPGQGSGHRRLCLCVPGMILTPVGCWGQPQAWGHGMGQSGTLGWPTHVSPSGHPAASPGPQDPAQLPGVARGGGPERAPVPAVPRGAARAGPRDGGQRQATGAGPRVPGPRQPPLWHGARRPLCTRALLGYQQGQGQASLGLGVGRGCGC